MNDKSATAKGQAAPRQQKLRFNSANVKSSYCNMCNATSTREEVVLNFGVNQNWDQPSTTPAELERLSEALSQLVRDYETRYGKLA